MDKVVLDVIGSYGGATFRKDAEALLLIEVDGDASLLDAQGRRIEEFCRARGAVEVQRASTQAEADKLWQARRSAFGAVASRRPNCIVEDATVPVKRLPEIIRKIVDLSQKYRLKIGVLAHAGDGNLHPLIMTDLRDKDEMERIERALEEMYETAIEMGGTLSGEHGIGIAKKRFLKMEFSDSAMEIMKGIKRVFDPDNILNPGSFLM
jgi:glycolate oxidase